MPEIGTCKTLVEIIKHHARERGDALAFHFEGRNTGYAAFDRHSNKVANALLAAGLKPGDRIAYAGKNSDHYFELMFGAMKAGMVMTPVNWRLAVPEMTYIINDAEAPALFVGPELASTVRDFLPDIPCVKLVVAMESIEDGWQNYERWRDAQAESSPPVPIDAETIAIQLYTSGTTGHPKGAMLSHRNLLAPRIADANNAPDWNTWTADDASLIAMPVFHIGGTGWAIFGLIFGSQNVVVREFDPATVLDAIQSLGISKLFLVPAAMQFVVRLPKARQVDYSRLKYLFYGASPIPVDLLKECIEVFRCGFVQLYGMTETNGAIVALAPEDHSATGTPQMRSAGKAMAGVELAVLDAQGHHLPPDQIGEIATRSIGNMVGYWKMPDATRATISAENWLRTGDAGFIDADGYVYIQDRIKDMIISGGENVYPAEVENAVFGHPAVAEVAVIGVPDERWGESVRAIVVKKRGMDVTAEEIISFARQRIAGFKAPKSVDFIDILPRNASGKILRRELREPYWQGKSRRVN